eukprot:TRINITY_DN1558_c0_g1_i1.p1 TRINITY_DN1558_c0_g1~~TRINITY_DN1558_c0_g1_i1.p1  ORF type:complete len:320 (-),score=50.65 TRINITY_DN1558_c0_g1_i1:173-1132(-)
MASSSEFFPMADSPRCTSTLLFDPISDSLCYPGSRSAMDNIIKWTKLQQNSMVSLEDLTFHPQFSDRVQHIDSIFTLCLASKFNLLTFHHAVHIFDQFMAYIGSKNRDNEKPERPINPKILGAAAVSLSYSRLGEGSAEEARKMIVENIAEVWGINCNGIIIYERILRKAVPHRTLVVSATRFIDMCRNFHSIDVELCDTAVDIVCVSLLCEGILEYLPSTVAIAALELAVEVDHAHTIAPLNTTWWIKPDPVELEECKEVLRGNLCNYEEYGVTRQLVDTNTKLYNYWTYLRNDYYTDDAPMMVIGTEEMEIIRAVEA